MRIHFNEQLEQLNRQLTEMGVLCDRAITNSVKCLSDGGHALIGTTFSIEEDIDLLEREVESLSMKLLLQQQPVATDLRTVSSALKMVSDMERIGDQARDIAEISKHTILTESDRCSGIHKLAEATTKMVHDSISAFVDRDVNLANAVIASDDVVDALFVETRNELIQAIKTDNEDAQRYVDLIMVAKYFERIGDHATNIAEWVEYAITGSYKGGIL